MYQPFQRGPLALSYDPLYVAPTTSTETETTETAPAETTATMPAGQAKTSQKP